MDASIEMKNVNEEMLKAIKSMLKTQPEIIFKVKKKKQEYSDKKLVEWAELAKEAERDYLAGKIKGYKTAEEMHKDIFNTTRSSYGSKPFGNRAVKC